MKNISLFVFMLISICVSGCRSIKEKEPKLHVIGIYEGTAPKGSDSQSWWARCGGAPMSMSGDSECQKNVSSEFKEVIVNVSDDSSPIVLALTAYDRTIWRVNVIGKSKLKKIILSGYETQKTDGVPDDVPIEVYTYQPSPCKHCIKGQDQSYFYSYSSAPGQLKKITGLNVSSFQGKYTGKEFSIYNSTK